MSKRKNKKQKTIQKKRSAGTEMMLMGDEIFRSMCDSGYTRLSDNPEIIMGCRKIANLISSMTIHLMNNTDNGDQRIINELSKKIDINPFTYMTRKTWMDYNIMNLLLYGRGNAIVLPHTKNGQLMELEPIRPGRVNFIDDGIGYKVMIDSMEFDPQEVLHFTLNQDEYRPWKGKGLNVPLREVADNLKQERVTEKGFNSDKWKPSLIINVDGSVAELATEEGRNNLLKSYIETSEAGKPWVIPSELINVTQVHPLSLTDLAIRDTLELNKQTVAAILGVPNFVVGYGSYNAEEWNNFINSTILPLATGIQQEMTKKLLMSPRWYFRFNIQSLYSYDLQTTATVYKDLRSIGVVTGNEVRDKIGLSPKEGLDELVMLENYIPTDKLADQLKLKQEE